MTTINNTVSSLYDERHGGPFDRGRADYFYQRGINPHYFKGSTYSSDRVDCQDMTVEQIAAYTSGYEDAEKRGIQKDWG